MKIYHNQLGNTLAQNLLPFWLVFGDEPWQKNDALVQIKQAAQQQGFDELIRFSADDKFDWQQVVDEYNALSLFSSLRIIEIELTSNKIGDAGAKALTSLSEINNRDTLIILHGAKLDAATSNRKWFKTLQNCGCYLPIYEMEGKSLTIWLQQQAKLLQLSISPDVIPLLCELFEGNLLALAQELEKLKIIFNTQTIQLKDAEWLVSKQAKFNPFQLIDAMLNADLPRCIKVLEQLHHEGTAAGQLVWFIHKEIKQLINMQQALLQGESEQAVFKQYRIWDKRKPLYQHALHNTQLNNLHLALGRLAQTDLLSKTNSEFNPFILLADVCTTLFYGDITKQFSLDYDFS
jgi:DNA polymerase-3 subunit delta